MRVNEKQTEESEAFLLNPCALIPMSALCPLNGICFGLRASKYAMPILLDIFQQPDLVHTMLC